METVAWSPLPELHVGPNHVPELLCKFCHWKLFLESFNILIYKISPLLEGLEKKRRKEVEKKKHNYFSGKIYLPKYHDHNNVYPW